MGATVVRGGDGPEALLAGSVPNLELDGLPLQVNGANLKVNADGADEALRVGVVREAQQ